MRSGRGSALTRSFHRFHEIAQALGEHRLLLLFAFDQRALIRHSGGDVRPVAELAPVLEWEVEQASPASGGELDRDLVDPVEGFAARQAVEHGADARADQAFEIGQILRRDDRLHHLALHVVLGRVHGDEHRQAELARPVEQGYAAERGIGREHPVIHFDRDDVLVLGDRPIGAERARLAIVDRGLAPEPPEIGLPHVLLVEFWIADVDLIEGRRQGEGGERGGVGGAARETVRDHGHWLASSGRPLASRLALRGLGVHAQIWGLCGGNRAAGRGAQPGREFWPKQIQAKPNISKQKCFFMLVHAWICLVEMSFFKGL